MSFKLYKYMTAKSFLILAAMFFIANTSFSQKHGKSIKNSVKSVHKKAKALVIKYGTASYYATRFHRQKTASGEIHDKDILTGACNSLPLNSWVKVTNLKNNKSVILKINDRLHKKNKRLLDVSYAAAKELAFISRGTTRVKMELLAGFKVNK